MLGTLWNIQDENNSALLADFYRSIANGVLPAQALRNMQLASDAGATIFPAIPTHYNQPQSTTDMARNFVHRVLAHIGLPQLGAYQWKPDLD